MSAIKKYLKQLINTLKLRQTANPFYLFTLKLDPSSSAIKVKIVIEITGVLETLERKLHKQ